MSFTSILSVLSDLIRHYGMTILAMLAVHAICLLIVLVQIKCDSQLMDGEDEI